MASLALDDSLKPMLMDDGVYQNVLNGLDIAVKKKFPQKI